MSDLLSTRAKTILILQSFSSGLPLALVTTTLQTWYSVTGASLYFVSLLSLVGQPYVYKFLWAPLLDHYYDSRLGKTKTWLLITQTALIIIIFLIGLLNPEHYPKLLAMLALGVAFFSASQDIVVDGYRVALLTPQTNAKGTLLYLTSFRFAFVVSSSLALIIADYLGWRMTYMAMALLLLPCWLATVMLSYPATAKSITKKVSLKENYLMPIKALLQKPHFGLLIGFIVMYGLGDAFISSLIHIYLLKYLKLSLTWVGFANKAMNIFGLFASTMMAGILLQRYSLYQGLKWFGWLQGAAIISFYGVAVMHGDARLQILALTIQTFAGGMCAFAIYALLNNICDKQYSLIHYTLLNTAISGVRLLLMPITGIIASKYGWLNLFSLGIIFTIPGLALLPFIAKKFAWVNVLPRNLPSEDVTDLAGEMA